MQRISEVMTRDVQFVAPRESVRRAAEMMDALNVGALPVCDGERLVGIVTDRDITVRATSTGAAPDDTLVNDVMSADVRWCFEDQSLDDVMQQMSDTQIRRVPVVSHDEARRLVGIVSLGDVATRAQADGREVGHVVGKLSSPSEPDREPARSQGGAEKGGYGAPRMRMASDVDTGAGLAGSDVLDAGMNPRYGSSTTGDPSDVVEVTPEDLVNRNAPGATSLNPERTGNMGKKVAEKDGVEVRRVEHVHEDTSSGESGAPAGVDVGAAGASGGTAGTAGSAGTGLGERP